MIDDETKYSFEQVIEFCHECRIEFVNRKKTRNFLYESGKTVDDLINEIRTLRVEHKSDEIELDYDSNHRGYVYQFKKLAFDMYWCYVKVKIKRDKNRVVVVLSFHKEEGVQYEQK